MATGAAQAITGSGATLSGALNPNGRRAMYWFQYGTTTAYGAQTAAARVASAVGLHTASVTVQGLAPLTTYHARIVASSCNGCLAGTAYGQDVSFVTGGYLNPVFGAAAAADPFVLDNNSGHNDYWAFTTGSLFPILHSTDLVHWTAAGTAMAQRPAWVVPSGDWHPWAPNVVQVNHGCPGTASPSCYLMYYVGFHAQLSVNCVAVATATSPGGPYTDRGPLSDGTVDGTTPPIGCADAVGAGMIDPSVFIDPIDGRGYLYASESYTCPPATKSCTPAGGTLAPTISVIPLSTDLLSAAGRRSPLFSGSPGTWEAVDVAAPTVEGPSMTFHNGTYYLLYSGGSWRSRYGMGYATGSTPAGPFTMSPANPILSTTASVTGPGGGDALVTGPNGGQWLVYHGRDGNVADPRMLRIDPISWRAVPGGPDAPVIAGPSTGPQSVMP